MVATFLEPDMKGRAVSTAESAAVIPAAETEPNERIVASSLISLIVTLLVSTIGFTLVVALTNTVFGYAGLAVGAIAFFTYTFIADKVSLIGGIIIVAITLVSAAFSFVFATLWLAGESFGDSWGFIFAFDLWTPFLGDIFTADPQSTLIYVGFAVAAAVALSYKALFGKADEDEDEDEDIVEAAPAEAPKA